MLKKLMGFMIALLVAQCCFAQSETPVAVKPDFDKIEKAINNKSSPFFYAPLMKRYQDDDTTLTQEEFRHLYYGFSMQKEYSAYGSSKLNDELRTLLQKKDKTAADDDKVIELERRILKEYPFNLRNLNTLVDYYDKKNDTVNGDKVYKKLIGVGRAILSTGDARTEATAAYVISVEHEYDLISLMGFSMGGGQALIQGKDGPMDKMKLKENDAGLEYLYFNVTQLFASMEKKLKN